MHSDLFVLKPKGAAVNLDMLLEGLKENTRGMADYISHEITEREAEAAKEVYEIATNKDKALERLEEIKDNIKNRLDNNDLFMLEEAAGRVIAVIDDEGATFVEREADLILDVIKDRSFYITNMVVEVYDYHT